ncbi:Cytochrome c553 [Variovorax sp. OK605]|jgi:cytochrome c553|uniref:c-type cytochrome n=1 Tax=unclassified Variovorax TaxID=663243 RepID=UPI0008D26CE7|nr:MULTISPECIES: c-type cytochrome [unclassified Variovorax]SEJ05838.1 Cytochrome c553 [Variovorax sp. OK202]SFB94631.1 Cytochrome c553 [Variovorax sp. OK212]SFO86157.1 Cytochrome c553 [Variovorax sp. OK605]
MKLFANILLAALVGLASSASLAADEHAATPNEAAAAPAKPAKPDPAKGDTLFSASTPTIQSCASCHNADGNSSIAANPKLAQQHPEYIVKQLQDFKSGKRKNSVMTSMASHLSDQDMRDIAWFVGSKKVKTGFSKDKDTIAMGEKIYRGGIGDRQVPACAGCHSPNGAGLPAQYPRLGGQNAEYTVAQLTAFRDNVRLNSAPMTGVAAKLNDREIRAVADYIAGLR